ncbi:hypothetical protein [Deinococcus metallilatus]|uniref:Tetratricopeptide (TPR) repeat protein n=2 Tax=Deinococcus metallilatus TaxID=1211322 RepID=A0ABR6MVT3_9DEIO|nr:hypothetical protein [Deinococcus metallilatus]MBB5295062.1 tetratricopeptide (TPR) repeat protein [Deinococcus metallilatus]GMA14834.1 hypothetical protein GCM10025871_11650 [Deinococcus metallilatus]
MRDDLVHQLGKRLGGLSAKRGGVAVALWGDAGTGKTWAARAALRALPFRSMEVQAASPLPVLLGALPRPVRLPGWTEQALRRLERGEGIGPEGAVDALGSLLSELAPFVLHVEDLHAASAEQLRLWSALAAAVTRSRGVALLATTRQRPPEPFEAQALPPLTREETAALLRQGLGADLPGEAATWIERRALGNPLFSLDYLRFLVRQGCLWNDGHRWHWRAPREDRIPSGVEALIAHLLHTAALSCEAQAALHARSVLPPEVPPEVWAQVARLDPGRLPGAREELERRGILRGGHFVHPLYREVNWRHLAHERQRDLARRAVAALQGTDVEAAAALVPQADLTAEEALPLLRRAAERAQEQGRGRRAAEFLTWAADRASGSERVDLALAAARLWREHEPGRMVALAERALAGQPGNLEATFLLAGGLVLQGEGERAERLIAALRDASGAEPRWLFQLMALHAERNDYVAVLDLWQAHPALHAEVPAPVLAQVVRALDFCGQTAGACALASRHLARAGLTDDERTALLFARARALYNAGEVTAAEADASEVVTLARAGGRRHDLARGLSTRATIRDSLGHYPEALADAQASLALFAELGATRDHAQQQSRLACLLLEYGEYAEAETLLQEGLEVMRRAGVSHLLALAEYNLAYLYLEQNPPFGGTLALKYAHAGLEHARQAGSPLIVAQTATMAARAEATHGSPERALALADEALELMRRHGSSHDTAWCTWARGFALEAAGRPAEALAAFRAGAEDLVGRGLTLWANRLGLEADRLAGDTAAAQVKLRFFEQHQLRNWMNVTARYFPALTGASSPVPGPACAVRLDVLGPVQLWRDGELLKYRGHKGKELLASLLETRLAGQAEVSQLALQEALYPELPDFQAASALQQLVYRLRQVLGQEAILRTDNGYRLGAVQSDAETFLSTGDTRLWRGPYLHGLGSGWDVTVEEALAHQLQRRARELLEDDPREAARLGRLLLEHDPYDRQALALTLRALLASGNRRGAQKLYDQSRERFLEVGEHLPAWETLLEETPA